MRVTKYVFSCAGWLVVVALLAASAAADMIVDNYSAATNNRYTNDKDNFIGRAYDFSGVGRRGSRWGTLIAPNIYLSAGHYRPANTVTFNATNVAGESTFTYTIRNEQRVGSTDLWIAAFDVDVDRSLKIYDYATEFLTTANFSSTYLNGAKVFMVGRSPGPGDFAVGENVVNAYIENENIFGQSDVDLLQMDYNDPADSSYQTYESYYQSGDSGGPTFAMVNGELQLIGINCCINPVSSAISYTGNQASEIGKFIAANSAPEPSSGILLSTLAIFCLTRRRRRHR